MRQHGAVYEGTPSGARRGVSRQRALLLRPPTRLVNVVSGASHGMLETPSVTQSAPRRRSHSADHTAQQLHCQHTAVYALMWIRVIYCVRSPQACVLHLVTDCVCDAQPAQNIPGASCAFTS